MEMNGDEKKSKPEFGHDGIQHLNDEEMTKKLNKDGDSQEEEGHLISKSVSQLGSMETDDGQALNLKGSTTNAELSKECASKDVAPDEVMKELRRLRRQNHITHCLLSVMIAVTTFWQFGELYALLKVKKKMSNPLGAVGDFIKSSIGRDEVKIEATPLPPIQVPELPHVDLPTLTFNGKR